MDHGWVEDLSRRLNGWKDKSALSNWNCFSVRNRDKRIGTQEEREISIGSCRYFEDFRKRDRDENLDNECSEACKKPVGKNRSKMIQRRIESIFAIETDIVSSPASFCLLNQPLIDLDRAIYIYIFPCTIVNLTTSVFNWNNILIDLFIYKIPIFPIDPSNWINFSYLKLPIKIKLGQSTYF